MSSGVQLSGDGSLHILRPDVKLLSIVPCYPYPTTESLKSQLGWTPKEMMEGNDADRVSTAFQVQAAQIGQKPQTTSFCSIWALSAQKP